MNSFYVIVSFLYPIYYYKGISVGSKFESISMFSIISTCYLFIVDKKSQKTIPLFYFSILK